MDNLFKNTEYERFTDTRLMKLRLYRSEEAEKRTGIPMDALHALAETGEISAIPRNGKLFFPEAEVERVRKQYKNVKRTLRKEKGDDKQ